VALLAVPALFLGVLYAYPVASIVGLGARDGGRWNLGELTELAGDASFRGVLGFTVGQAVLSTVVTLALGLPGAWVLARFDFPGRALVRGAVTVPFVLPTVVVASAFLALAGPRGVFDSVVRLDGTVAAIVVAHVFFDYAIVIRVVGGLWARLDPRVEDAARALGATRAQVLRHVTLPLLRPAIASAAVLVFLFTFTSFGVVQLLGGPEHATLEVEIARTTRQLLDLPRAAALAVVQLLTVAALLVVQARLRDRTRAAPLALAPAATTARRPRTAGERTALGANLAVMAALLGAPLLVLVERSFRVGDGYGLTWWDALGSSARGSTLFVTPWAAVRTSLGYAAVAAVIALLIGGAAAVAVAARTDRLGRAADTVLALPLGTSAVTVGFGFLVALDTPPLDLRGSWWIVPLAHALVGVPFVVRTLVPALRAVEPRLREAAATLGAPPGRVWREIDLPLVGRGVLVAGGFAFAVSLGEFGATTVLGRDDTPTVPLAIARFLGRPGEANFGQAMAMSVVLLVITAVVVALADRGRVGDVGGF
jgi:thiamine transport system permease protein